mmetsp:Transcript_37788/g.55270  ORF Transcript_37788/g.55270 Transcript_37788/m.55270 type:complete len:106 (+) Transcript_37788:2999-3316(+)
MQQNFDKERKVLISRNRRELETFDDMTTDMNSVPKSHAERNRENARAKLQKKQQRAAVLTLVGSQSIEVEENAKTATTAVIVIFCYWCFFCREKARKTNNNNNGR